MKNGIIDAVDGKPSLQRERPAVRRPHGSRRTALVALAIVGCLSFPACGRDGTTLGPEDQSTEPTEPLFPDDGAETISFSGPREITLQAGLMRTVSVQVSPPGVYTVRFAVIAEIGDAYVTDSVVQTNEAGIAETTLRVLRPELSIALRAAVGELDAELGVVSGPSSVASLLVIPDYGGTRPVEQWTVSAHADRICRDVMGFPLEDSDIVTRVEATEGATALLLQVPAAVPVATMVRAGQFAAGCSNIVPLTASTQYLTDVSVIDRPIQVQGSVIRLALGIEEAPDFGAVLDELGFQAAVALAGEASSDLAAVFAAMRALVSNPSELDAAIQADDWQATALTVERTPLAGSGLRALARGWLREAGAELSAPDALVAELSAVDDLGVSSLSLLRVATLDAAPFGFRPQGSASVLAESDDFLRIGFALDFQPGVYLPAVAAGISTEAFPEASGPAEALARAFDCEGFSSDIIAASTQPGGAAFGTCGELCLSQLCSDAMVSLWARVTNAGLPTLPMEVSIAGKASVNLEAQPVSLAGNWAGSLNVTSLPALLPLESATLTGPFGAERRTEGLPEGAQ